MKINKAGEENPTGKVDPPGFHTQDEQNTKPTEKGQETPPVYLIGSADLGRGYLKACPFAASIVGFSLALQEWVIIQNRCKRWGCSHCGPRKIAHYARKVGNAEPNRFVTLTVWTEAYESPRDAYDKTRRSLSKLSVRIRKRIGEWEYFRVLEVTKKGWPHYHLIVRSPYISQAELSTLWAELAQSKIVDIRKIKGKFDVYKYIVKYLGKQKHIPWTDRRVSWSRNFWKADDFKPGGSLQLEEKEFKSDHPENVLSWYYEDARVVEWSADCWLINPRNDKPVIVDE